MTKPAGWGRRGMLVPSVAPNGAQPETDWRNTDQNGRTLYLRPMLRENPEKVVYAVAYMIPLINYDKSQCKTYTCGQ